MTAAGTSSGTARLGPLEQLPPDLQIRLTGFLSMSEVLALSETSKRLFTIARTDMVWRERLKDDLGITTLTDRPPGEEVGVIVEAHQSFALYRDWRRSFNLYPNALVKGMRMWWKGMEDYLEKNLPAAYRSLGPPLSEHQIEAVLNDDRSGYASELALPKTLRLLYRFHDGQILPGQRRLLHEKGPHKLSSRAEVLELGLGLFGGVSYYTDWTVCYLLPLRSVVVLNRPGTHYLDTHQFACRTSSIFNAATSHSVAAGVPAAVAVVEPERDRGGKRSSDFVLFAINALNLSTHTPYKGFFVERSGGSGVFTNTRRSPPVDSDLELTPCVSRAQRVVAGAGPAAGSILLAWLLEYLRRLKEKVYVVAPLSQTATTTAEVELQNNQAATPHYISLFDASSKGRVTSGVELKASPYLVSHQSAAASSSGGGGGGGGGGATLLFWTYKISMRLIRSSDSRPPRLGSCQLVSRHWRIASEQEGEQAVDGPGVVGEFPLLTLEAGEKSAWAYSSCSHHRESGVLFGGKIKFRCAPGSLSLAAASQAKAQPARGSELHVSDSSGQMQLSDEAFEATLPTMALDVACLNGFLY
jgi:uncharacterized protein affecting Mg2+/Co2+ transport